jgi:hypothetical protein
MIILELKPTRRAKQLLNFVDFEVLESCATILVNNFHKIDTSKKLSLKLDISTYPSKEQPWNHYKWKQNVICFHSYKECNPKYKLRRFMDGFIHEFRHWAQDRLLKVSFFKNYSGDGMEYYRCPIEKDTRTYTKLVLNPTLKLYKNLLEVKHKTNEFSKLDIKFN